MLFDLINLLTNSEEILRSRKNPATDDMGLHINSRKIHLPTAVLYKNRSEPAPVLLISSVVLMSFKMFQN